MLVSRATIVQSEYKFHDRKIPCSKICDTKVGASYKNGVIVNMVVSV